MLMAFQILIYRHNYIYSSNKVPSYPTLFAMNSEHKYNNIKVTTTKKPKHILGLR